MQEALRNELAERSDMYRCEMADFLYRKFTEQISERSVGRTLGSMGWTRKTIRRIAQQRDADLRHHHLHRVSQYESINLYLLISLAAIDELDTGDRDDLQRVSPQSRLRSSVAEKDSTFFRPTRKTARAKIRNRYGQRVLALVTHLLVDRPIIALVRRLLRAKSTPQATRIPLKLSHTTIAPRDPAVDDRTTITR